MAHGLGAAGEEAAVLLGILKEIGQWIFEGEDDYHSAFSPEDMPSNEAGGDFGEDYAGHYDTLTEAIEAWLEDNGALPTTDPDAGFENLPATDPAVGTGGGSSSGGTGASGSGGVNPGGAGNNPNPVPVTSADPPGHPLYICFPAGTLVHTADGMTQIEKINAGTMVWSFQIETGEWILKPVLSLEENGYAGRMVSIISSGIELDATVTHPFWVVSGDRLNERPPARSLNATEKAATTPFGRWVEAGALQLGDELLLRSGNTAIIAELNTYSQNLSVFNIAVEHLRNYCVGELGVLVHNT